MTRLALTFFIAIPVLWLCWFAYLVALWVMRGIYWIKGVKA